MLRTILSTKPMPASTFARQRGDPPQSTGPGEFFKGLSSSEVAEFELLAEPFCCPAETVLIQENQEPASVLFLIDGKVDLRMDSFAGRRLIVEIAGPGEILGLSAAISGNRSEVTVEARSVCRVARVERQQFLGFLLRHPLACQNVMREMSRQHTRTCDKLRIFGLASSTHARLARLLLDWCTVGRRTNNGTEIRCLLTHEEIGECIGASRETVTRVLNDLRSQELVELRGSVLLVPSHTALASFAEIGR